MHKYVPNGPSDPYRWLTLPKKELNNLKDYNIDNTSRKQLQKAS